MSEMMWAAQLVEPRQPLRVSPWPGRLSIRGIGGFKGAGIVLKSTVRRND